MNTMLRCTPRLILLLALLVALIPADAQARQDATPFLGSWSLHLPGGAGWLNVEQKDGFLDAELLWYGGSVLPVSHVFIDGGNLFVTRVSQAEHQDMDETRTHWVTNAIQVERDGEGLKGTGYFPNRDGMGVQKVDFTGTRVPPLPDAPDLSKATWGEPVMLFNGKDLTGWTLTNPEQVNGFSVENGELVNKPEQHDGEHHISYGNLRTEQAFEDFNLKLQVNFPAGSNSGVYLRGIYEVQVVDSHGKPLDSHNMGGLYSRIKPSVAAERPAGEWQDMDLTLYKRHLTVVLNGQTIIDNQPVRGVTGGALTADESKPGPIYLQGDHGEVRYRNMVLTPIVK